MIAQAIGGSARESITAVFCVNFFELPIHNHILIDSVIFAVKAEKTAIFCKFNHQVFSAVNGVCERVSVNPHGAIAKELPVIFLFDADYFTPVCANVVITADNHKTIFLEI